MTFSSISNLIVPAFVMAVIGYALFKRVDLYAAFVAGAKKGLISAFNIAPYLVAMLTAIAVFRTSGALGLVVRVASPLFSLLGIPPEIAPLVLLRPFSGSASLAMLDEILRTYGADTAIGLLASTVMGSSETLFYTVAVYFGAVGVTKTRYTIGVGLLAMLAGLLAASIICSIVF